MKNTVLKRLFAFMLSFVIIFAFFGCAPKHSNAPTSKVILFIGDGMGANHVHNTELYAERDMYFSSYKTQLTVDTNSLDGLTDSAAAATAMATGQRVNNDRVAVDLSSKKIKSITELAKENKYGAGVVTSDLVTGATPAGFSAHAISRDSDTSIIESQAQSKLDLLLGASSGYELYNAKYTQAGFTLVDSFSQLKTEDKRYVGDFDLVVPNNATDNQPTLTQLAVFAINYMETNYPEGYFLMIEGAKIDKASHSKDLQTMIDNLLDFENAIKEVEAMLKATGDNYSIIITADHETGGLNRAESKEQLNDKLYTSTKHTAVNVPLYFTSTLAETPSILKDKTSILNTDIFFLCKYLLAIK